jgi:hypothetical protein
MDAINVLNDSVGHVLPKGGLYGLLNFLDVLGWNKDVKYHTENNTATFKGHYGFKVGRINTIMTCVRVPFEMSLFIKEAKSDPSNAIATGFTMMQTFAKSRGTCIPNNESLLKWLSPQLYKE